MTPAEILDGDLSHAASTLRARDEPFAFATIVRTAGATAAKPGTKAVVSADGTILRGWLGGGCTRGAVKRAVLEAITDGAPRLISVAPEAELTAKDLAPGEVAGGVHFARNGCPSEGTIDIFIEPVLPLPELVIYGGSPVADALSHLAPQFHWGVSRPTAGGAHPATGNRRTAIVIATQGQGDLEALRAALGVPSARVSFVGSKKKFAALALKLAKAGVAQSAIEAVRAPAGLNIGAVTPEEIALSILAELVSVLRMPDERHTDG